MIAFQTLLLGIVIGHLPIRMMVAPPVTRVEIRLDGVAIGTLTGPPWTLEHDFGTDPIPHKLAGVGFDRSGREVGRVVRWLNLGREKAGVSLALERDAATGRPVLARVAWDSLVAVAPPLVTATLDGVALRVTDPKRIALPKVALGTTHLLSVEAAFRKDLRDRADVAFGGDVIDAAESELTAIAVTRPAGEGPAALDELQHLFSVDSAPRAPIALETGIAEVALVFDEAVRWRPHVRIMRFADYPSSVLRLKPADDRFFVVSSIAEPRPDAKGRRIALYPQSPPARLSLMSDFRVLFSMIGGVGPDIGSPAIPTAVTVAGAEVAARSHRRAVVLLLGERRAAGAKEGSAGGASSLIERTRDANLLTAAAAKTYLAALDVPLVVWSLTGPSPGPLTAAWGRAEDVSSAILLRAAVEKLEAMLAAQQIVWFAGRHLPQRITLDERATNLRLAR